MLHCKVYNTAYKPLYFWLFVSRPTGVEKCHSVAENKFSKESGASSRKYICHHREICILTKKGRNYAKMYARTKAILTNSFPMASKNCPIAPSTATTNSWSFYSESVPPSRQSQKQFVCGQLGHLQLLQLPKRTVQAALKYQKNFLGELVLRFSRYTWLRREIHFVKMEQKKGDSEAPSYQLFNDSVRTYRKKVNFSACAESHDDIEHHGHDNIFSRRHTSAEYNVINVSLTQSYPFFLIKLTWPHDPLVYFQG